MTFPGSCLQLKWNSNTKIPKKFVHVILIQYIFAQLIPITHSIFDPALPQGRGVGFHPPTRKHTKRGLRLFFFYRIINLYKTRQNPKAQNPSFENGALKFFEKQISPRSLKCEKILSPIKSPPFPQILTFWPLVFCKHPILDHTTWLCNKNGVSKVVRGPIFENFRFFRI